MSTKQGNHEPDWCIYSEFFAEVRNGRSLRSVAEQLREDGYSLSETLVRGRYREWLVSERTRELTEAKIEEVKSELLAKLDNIEAMLVKLSTLEEELREVYNRRQVELQEQFEKWRQIELVEKKKSTKEKGMLKRKNPYADSEKSRKMERDKRRKI